MTLQPNLSLFSPEPDVNSAVAKHGGTADGDKHSEKPPAVQKRAQSQHNERKRAKPANEEEKPDLFEEIEKFKEIVRKNNYLGDKPPEDIAARLAASSNSKEFLEAEFTFQGNMTANSKLAEERKAEDREIKEKTDELKARAGQKTTSTKCHDREDGQQQDASFDNQVRDGDQDVSREEGSDDDDDYIEEENNESHLGNDTSSYNIRSNQELSNINDSYNEYDYEQIPEFKDAKSLIDMYFKEHSQPSRMPVSDGLK